MVGWALRIILILLIIRAVVALVRGLWGGLVNASRVPAGDSPRSTRGTLVQDPVCGTFVVRDRALSAHIRGETHYFCSEECRRSHAARPA